MKNHINIIFVAVFTICAVFPLIPDYAVYAQSIVINEVMASNGSTIADEDGDYEDWIELLNVSDTEISLMGYGLSDDYNNPFRWVFPDIVIGAGEFLLVWASGKDRSVPGGELHTNFSIASAGEEIILTRPDGILVDELPPTPIPRDISYGRQPDGTDDWFYFKEPTPADSNTTEPYLGILDPPVFSHEGGFYSSPFDLYIEAGHPDSEIYYSLDGSEPGDTSLYYTGSVYVYERDDIPNDISEIPTNIDYNWQPPGGQINKIMVVRARTFRDGYIPSETVTHSYVVDPAGANRYTFSVVSLATHRDNFFDDEIGIYVPGIHYVPNPEHPWHQQGNFTQRGIEWERPVHFEYFGLDGIGGLYQNAGVRIHGGASRSSAQKSLRLYSRSRYEHDWFEYPFFIDKDIPRVKRFILRNSGQDWQYTMLRDVMMQQLVRELDLDYQAYRPVIVFLNGEYWGIHNLRERIDKYYLETNYGVDPENVDLLTGNMVVIEGDNYHFNNLRSFLSDNDITDPDNYAYVRTQMEFRNFIDYNTSQIYIRNTDWPANNNDYWRPRTPEGRWRWILYDTDFGFGRDGGPNAYLHNTLAFATAENSDHWANPPWATFMLRTLLQNEEFKIQFVNRFADLLNTLFLPERVIALIDTLQEMYEPEIEEHQHRWYPNHTPTRWLNQINVMRTFAEKRPQPVREHIMNHFGLSGMDTVTVKMDDLDKGNVLVNSVHLDHKNLTFNDSLNVYYWNGIYFRDVPVTVIAEPSPGYFFAGWDGYESESDTIQIYLEENITLRPQFFPSIPPGIMNPDPFDLSEGSYEFNYWSPEEPEWSYPPHMVFQQTRMDDPKLADEMTDPYHIPYIDGDNNEYHEDDQDKIGFPYMLTGRTRINGLEDDGISFINTGRGRDLGAAVLAVQTTGRKNITVTWTGGTIIPNSRTYHIRLQYRIGKERNFIDVIDNGEPVEYVRNEVPGHAEIIGPVVLPAETEDQPYVQIRWKYYFTGERLDPDIGRRDMLRLDNIVVESQSSAEIPEVSRVLQNYPNPFNSTTTIRYELASLSTVRIEIFNSLGQRVDVINEGLREPGTYEVAWNTSPARIASGVYYYRTMVTDLESGDNSILSVKKMIHLK